MVRQVARIDPAAVGFGAPAADRETKTEPGPVCSTLLERLEQEIGVAVGQTATFVLDFNQHTVRGRSTTQCHGRPGSGELEGILQQIPHGRGQNRSVRVDARSRVPLLELALRRSRRRNALTQRFQVLCYLAEVRPDNFGRFVNERRRWPAGWLILGLHLLRSLYKLAKGRRLMRVHDIR